MDRGGAPGRVRAYVDAGADDVNISMRTASDVESVERFADLVWR